MPEPADNVSIAFKLEGAAADNGLVRFSDFATFVAGALSALRSLEREMTNARTATIEYRITELEVGSASLTLEPIAAPDHPGLDQRVVERFAEGMAAVRDGLADLAPFGPAVRDAFGTMMSPLRRGVRSIAAVVGDTTISVVRSPAGAVTVTTPSEESAAVGSFSGSVDALNVHGDHFFYLYPPAGPTRVKCVYAPALLESVRNAVKRYTTVHGLVEYAEPSSFPTRIIVDRIEAHPDERDLPTLADLWGSRPDLTGGLDEVDFVRRLRDVE
jgi:hypothetical protein